MGNLDAVGLSIRLEAVKQDPRASDGQAALSSHTA
jgi:hypothetical protein